MKPYPMSVVLFAFTAMAAAAQSPPPAAPVRPVIDDYFGAKVTDNYRWMENLKDPDMQRWMKAQADYTRTTLDSLPGYPALLKRVDELTTSYPAAVSGVQIVGMRYYSLRRPANAQSPKLPKLYVRDGIKGEDTLLIDPDQIPGNEKSHYSIHDYRPSPDGHYVLLDEPRQPLTLAQVGCLRPKGLEVIAHDPIQHARRRIARNVRASDTSHPGDAGESGATPFTA